MNHKNSFIFDYDSTLISIESLDLLLCQSLRQDTARKEEVEAITNAGMAGTMPLQESLQKRLQIASISEEQIQAFRKESILFLTPGIQDFIKFLQEKNQEIFILSGGFQELIFPLADFLKIPQKNVFANQFLKENNQVIGIDFQNPLTQGNGKSQIIASQKKSGKMPGKIFCIGDGISDAQPFLDGIADQFLGFGQNIIRESVQKKAKHFFLNTQEMQKFVEKIL